MNMYERVVRLVVLVAMATLFAGCHASGQHGPGGSLVIVGGALSDDNTDVFRAFVSRCAGGPIGIVPTASGDGIAAGESNVKRFQHAANGRQVIVIPLTQNDGDKANDPAVAELIRSCGGLWFTGGDQSRITRVFRPDQAQRTEIYNACWTVLQRDGVIGGTSAGAAMMSDPMIAGGRARGSDSRQDAENDRAQDTGVRIGPGMGFLSLGLTDQHFLQRARMGRLIEALEKTGMRLGFGISENCAMVVDRHAGRFAVEGELGVIALRLEPTGDLRVSIFSSGDRGSLDGGWHAPSPNMRAVARTNAQPVEHAVDNVYGRDAVAWLVRAIGDGATSASVRDGTQRLTISIDGKTSVYADPSNHRPPMVVGAMLRVHTLDTLASR